MVNSIAGDPPNLLRPPEGCRFYPRCVEKTPDCDGAHGEPDSVEVGPGHFVRCVLAHKG